MMKVKVKVGNMDQVKVMYELHELNKRWFDANKHLSNKQMLAAGLIDECDLVWVNRFRNGENASI